MCWILPHNNRAHRILFLNQKLYDHKQHIGDKTHRLSAHWGGHNDNNKNNNSSHLGGLLRARPILNSSQTSSQAHDCSQHPHLQTWKQRLREFQQPTRRHTAEKEPCLEPACLCTYSRPHKACEDLVSTQNEAAALPRHR